MMIPNIWKKIMFQTTNQIIYIYMYADDQTRTSRQWILGANVHHGSLFLNYTLQQNRIDPAK